MHIPDGFLANDVALAARGERVYVAMLARGYAGTMPRLAALSFGRADTVFLAGLALGLVPLRVVAA